MKYINLTPRWTEILGTWQRIVDHNTRHRVNKREQNVQAMRDFWNEMERMAQGADNFNDLVAALREEGWADSAFDIALRRGRELQEIERNTIKESQDVVS